jgi:hypothetical protein
VVTRDGVSTVETEKMSEWASQLVRDGADRGRIEAALRAEGYEPASDTRTRDEMKFDEAFGAPARGPDGYKINYVGRIPNDADPAAFQELDTVGRRWLHAMSFSKELGESLLEGVFDLAKNLQSMTPADRQSWKDKQDALLVRLAHGEEGAKRARDLAETMLTAAPAGVTKVFREAGSLDSAAVIMNLALQGERIVARGHLRR